MTNILAMCAAMALFMVNDVCVKLAAGSWPPHQIMVIRGGFAIVAMGIAVAILGDLARWRRLLSPFVILRGLLESFVAVTFISALTVLPIADVTALILVSPLLITVAGALIFREPVRWRRWLAVLVGFVGMLLVVQPSGGGSGFAILLALASTVGIAARDLLTRRLPDDVPSSLVALSTTVATTLAGIMMSLTQGWSPVSAFPVGLSALAGVMVAAGNLAIVMAFRQVEVSVVSPFRYTLIVWAIIGGNLVFGEKPSMLAWIGIILIVSSGLFTLHREKKTAATHEKSA